MLKPSLQLKLGQSLTMTPQLQQAIRLLQLPVLDLNAQIQDALEENIMLEMEDLPDVPRTTSETTVEVEAIDVDAVKADDTWQIRMADRSGDAGWNGEGRPSRNSRTRPARRCASTCCGNWRWRISRRSKR